MNLQELTRLLEHEKPSVRVMSIHVLRMVDEVQALNAIRSRIPREKSPKIRGELEATAGYLMRLLQNGYNTIAVICQQFNVYSDVLRSTDPGRFEVVFNMLRQLQVQRQVTGLQDKHMRASLILAARVIGDTSELNPAQAMKKLKPRFPPTTPTNKDISKWVDLLKSDKTLDRDQALFQLSMSGNPAALQYMAHTYSTDPDQKIRDTAKRLGRKLYWNRIYYDMQQDGTLNDIRYEFAVALKLIEDNRRPEIKEESIAEILARAEEERSKRGWKR